MLGLFSAEDEGGGELESVGGTERVDAEEAHGAGADFGGWNDLGPLIGDFMQALPCRMFDVCWQLTGALATDQRGLDFREGSKPHHGPRIRVVLFSSQVGGCFGDEKRNQSRAIPEIHRPSLRSSRIASVRRELLLGSGKSSTARALGLRFGGTTNPSATSERTCSSISSCSSG